MAQVNTKDDVENKVDSDWVLVPSLQPSQLSSKADLVASYFTNLQQLIDLTQLNSDYQIIMVGFGFDSLSASLSFLRKSAVIRNLGEVQTALFLHLKSVALTSPAVEYTRAFSQTFYMEPSTVHGFVELYMSVQTADQLKRSRHSLVEKNGIVVKKNSAGIPKFFLSSRQLLDHFEHSQRQLLLAYCKHRYASYSKHDMFIKEGAQSGAEMDFYAIKRIPVILCLIWPESIIHEWMGAERSHSRQWPPRDVVSAVSKTECFIAPCGYFGRPPKNTEWSYRFDAGEKLLSSKLDAAHLDAFSRASDMLFSGEMHFAADIYLLLKASFFWCLETAFTSATYLMGTAQILQRTKDYLKSQMCPHYFIPSINILAEINDDECAEMLKVVSRMLRMVHMSSNEYVAMAAVGHTKSTVSSPATVGTTPFASASNFRSRSGSMPKLLSYPNTPIPTPVPSEEEIVHAIGLLKDLFSSNSEILLLRAYVSIRTGRLVESVVDEHRCILEMIDRFQTELLEVKAHVKLFFSASLAMSLALQTFQASRFRSRLLFIEAERLLKTAIAEASHLSMHKIYLAIIYAVQGKHTDVIGLLDTNWSLNNEGTSMLFFLFTYIFD